MSAVGPLKASDPGPSRLVQRITLQPSGLQFDADANRTILGAALDAGVALPSSCRNGTCRTCRAQLIEGQARHTIEWPGLSYEEKAEGWILPCVASATTDLVLRAPAAKWGGQRE